MALMLTTAASPDCRSAGNAARLMLNVPSVSISMTAEWRRLDVRGSPLAKHRRAANNTHWRRKCSFSAMHDVPLQMPRASGSKRRSLGTWSGQDDLTERWRSMQMLRVATLKLAQEARVNTRFRLRVDAADPS